MPLRFYGVHGGRATTISRSRMRSDHRAQQRTRRQRLRALISLYPGKTTQIFMARHFVMPRLSSRPTRSSDLIRKRSGRLGGDSWVVTAFVCNYGDLSVLLKVEGSMYFMVTILLSKDYCIILGQLSPHDNCHTYLILYLIVRRNSICA